MLTVIHGFGDHGGRFSGLGASLASWGIGVCAVDLVGHGRSPGKQGCIQSYDQLLDDVEHSIERSIQDHPSVPHFLMGKSMGGNLILNLALRRPESVNKIQGLIACSPMLKPTTMPKEKFMNAGRWLATKIPNWRIKAPVDVSKLSSDRRAQDAYLRDRYVHRNMSLRLAANLVDSGIWATNHSWLLKKPALLMHGSEDKLACPVASQCFADGSNGTAKFKMWPGCRHDLHEDVQRERVFAYMTHWMKQQCIVTMKLNLSSNEAA